MRRDIFEQLSSIRNHGSSPAAGLTKMFHDGGSTNVYPVTVWGTRN